MRFVLSALQLRIDKELFYVAQLNSRFLRKGEPGEAIGAGYVVRFDSTFCYSQDCIDCQRLSAVWEGLGANLRNRVNVARVNRLDAGKATAKRFNVEKSPEFIFIRQGKFYRYETPKYDIKTFTSFAQDWFRNARAAKVMVPSSPFDDVVSAYAEHLKKGIQYGKSVLQVYPYAVYAAVGGAGLVVLAAILSKFKSKKVSAKATKKVK